MSTSPTGPAAKSRVAGREREFIRGNRDGASRANATYTVCRIGISQERLDEEMQLGFHSHFVSASGCWDCPGQMFVKAEKKWLRRASAKDQGRYAAPSAVALERWQQSGHDKGGAEALEIIQRNPGGSGDGSTFTICRVAVPRETMVREVEAGLHPRYHVRKSKRGRYVQGNPPKAFDNVNYPDGETPGLGARELCPFRLLRPGAQL